MKVAYISSVSFSDVDLSLLLELQNSVDLTYYLQVYPSGKRGAAVNINSVYPQSGCFSHDIYPELATLQSVVRKTELKVINRTKDRTLSWPDIKSSYSLYKHLKKGHYDVIHLTWPPGLTTIWLYLFYRRKIILTVHDPIPHSSLTSKAQIFTRNLSMWLCRHFILLNTSQRDEFIKYYKIKNHKQNIYSSKLSCYNYLKAYVSDIKFEYKYILFFGKIYSYKGLQYLFPAMKLVHEQHPDIKLLVAGSGDFCFDIKEYEHLDYIIIKNRFIPDSELAGLIDNALFVVAPYTDATQSGVVMSAFAFNKPCLVTRVGALPETVLDHSFGRVVEALNIEALATTICEMISDQDSLKKYSENIQLEYGNGNHSWKEIAAGITNVYKRVVKQS